MFLVRFGDVKPNQKNTDSHGAKHGLTMWADLTQEEFKSFQNYGKVGGTAHKSKMSIS